MSSALRACARSLGFLIDYNNNNNNTKFVKRRVAVALEALENRTVKKHRRRTNVLCLDLNNVSVSQFGERQGESSRQMVLQCWKSVCRRKFVWMGHAAVARTTIAMTACYFVSWCVDWDIPALTSDVSCRSGQLLCKWCAAPLVTNAAPASASWREIAAAPAVRLYMQASVLGPLSVVVVHGGSLVRGNCTISPRLTRGSRMSGDGREWRQALLLTNDLQFITSYNLHNFVTIRCLRYVVNCDRLGSYTNRGGPDIPPWRLASGAYRCSCRGGAPYSLSANHKTRRV